MLKQRNQAKVEDFVCFYQGGEELKGNFRIKTHLKIKSNEGVIIEISFFHSLSSN